MAMNLLYIFLMICPVFGLIRLVWERKLIISRKVVSGTDSFYTTTIGCIVGTGGLWELTGSYICAAAYLSVIIAAYIAICVLVKKKEYPEQERFTKEW